MVRFTQGADAALGRPVESLVPLMHRPRWWLYASIAAAVVAGLLLTVAGLQGFVRAAIIGAVAAAVATLPSRQHLLVRADGGLWLVAAKRFNARPDMLVGEVARDDVTITTGRFHDVLRIGEARYVLPRLFREHAAALISPTTVLEPDTDDGSPLD